MIIIVGLGNPDKIYEKTYHNIGFLVVDEVAKEIGAQFTKTSCKAKIAEGFYHGEKIILAKPQTYMNNSGESLVMLKNKFKDARILVVVDDIDILKGEVRYREHGSAGTHNGLRSIVSYIGENFERVKVGIGRDISMGLADYVLSKIDMDYFKPVIEKAKGVVLEKIWPSFKHTF